MLDSNICFFIELYSVESGFSVNIESFKIKAISQNTSTISVFFKDIRFYPDRYFITIRLRDFQKDLYDLAEDYFEWGNKSKAEIFVDTAKSDVCFKKNPVPLSSEELIKLFMQPK